MLYEVHFYIHTLSFFSNYTAEKVNFNFKDKALLCSAINEL